MPLSLFFVFLGVEVYIFRPPKGLIDAILHEAVASAARHDLVCRRVLEHLSMKAVRAFIQMCRPAGDDDFARLGTQKST